MPIPYTREWFEALFDTLPDMVFAKDDRCRLMWGNAAFQKIYGLTNAEMRDIVDKDEADPDDTVKYIADDSVVMRERKPLQVDETVTDASGQIGFVRTRKWPLIDSEDQVFGLLGVATPLADDRHQSVLDGRQDVKQRLAELRALVGAIPQPVVMLDRSHRVVASSAMWSALFVQLAEDVVGEPFSSVSSDLPLDRWLQSADDAQGVTGPHRVQFVARDGSRRVADAYTHAWELPRHGTGGTIVVMQDLTAVIATEMELRRANAELAQFGYRVAHDLIAPLKTAQGLANVARETLEKGDQAASQMVLARLQARLVHMSELVERLNEAARVDVEDATLERVEVAGLVSLVFGSVERAASRRSITLERTGSAVLVTQVNRLRQVLYALLDNAIKFSHEGAPGHVVVAVEDTAETVYIRITDHGIGVPAASEAHIFDQFSRGTSKRPGNGLGLHVAAKHAARLGGHVKLISPAGPTTFEVALPKVSERTS